RGSARLAAAAGRRYPRPAPRTARRARSIARPGAADPCAAAPGQPARPAGCRRSGEPSCRPLTAMAWSADDVEVVTDLHDAACHPRGADDRVAFGPGTDVPAQRHRVAAG